MRILVIEDEDAIREVLVELCQKVSTEVYEARNGFEGLALLNEKKFDLIISDYQMPKMSGLDLLQASRAANIRIPTIWLSGRDNPELKNYAWEYGLFDYLEKPFNVEDLNKSMAAVKNMSALIKDEFFGSYIDQFFNIPYEVIANKIGKATLCSFFEYCEKEKTSPNEMVKKLLAQN